MLNNITVYSADKYWRQILADLGAFVAESPNVADVVFDDIAIDTPVSVAELKNAIFKHVNNADIIRNLVGRDVVLPPLQNKIVVLLYKNHGMTLNELKTALGMSPGVTSHVVENAIYQLRRVYGRAFIQNINGKYQIGRI